ncbi:superinfection immunity protein [Streptomyces sp. BBFR2]|uniref:superinfection immunity protein n=1 Tax=Streptomyces sp. BBFR2 TaxID=3372854 RepID=UPI0037DA5B25
MNDREVWCKVFDLKSLAPVVAVALAAVVLVIYFIPTYVAFRRKVEVRWVVLAINVFLGGSLVGWVIALVLATRKPAGPPQTA